jgi:crotonobetainyl-CoA:carnitine CoA-transferase CaiB-like acyl-CoA transferase
MGPLHGLKVVELAGLGPAPTVPMNLIDDVPQPAPAPRFSRTPTVTPRPPRSASRDDALASLRRWWGAEKQQRLNQAGALACVSGNVEGTT